MDIDIFILDVFFIFRSSTRIIHSERRCWGEKLTNTGYNADQSPNQKIGQNPLRNFS
ncbi:unnamed protein product, partial [Nesidiocoris tenuis]